MTKLQQAYQDYWDAKTHKQERDAYSRIILYGGQDAYGIGGFPSWVAWRLRKLALWFER